VRAALDAAAFVVFGGACAGSGYWCRATVDDWRMRRLLVRINERLNP